MSDVGISGGMLLQHMGTPAEVAAFFALIERHKSESISGTLDLVTDRLYRRTVPGEQYDALVDQLAECRRLLQKIQITEGFWDEFKLGDRTKAIDRSAKTAADAFQKIFKSLYKAIDYVDAIISAHDGKVQMIDSIVVRAHQQAAAQKTSWRRLYRSKSWRTDDQASCLRRWQRPAVQLELSAGQANDAPMAELLLNDLPRGAVVLAVRAYDADWIREFIEDQECKACIPPKVNRTEPASYSKRTYKKRNLIERNIGKLKQFRYVSTRFDRSTVNYLAMAKLAAVRLWLRHYESAASSRQSELDVAKNGTAGLCPASLFQERQ